MRQYQGLEKPRGASTRGLADGVYAQAEAILAEQPNQNNPDGTKRTN